MSGRDKDKGWNWPIIGLLISVGYGLVLWFSIRLVHGLAIAYPSHWLALELNELGDFLAGAFAPLAFLWLFVAVMVQSQELRLQREELKLTRREFELSREVLKTQADESRKQAEYIGQQTELMNDQAKRAERLRADERVTTLMASTVAWAKKNLSSSVQIQVPNQLQNFYLSYGVEGDRSFSILCENIIQISERIESVKEKGNFEGLKNIQPATLQELAERLRNIASYYDAVDRVRLILDDADVLVASKKADILLRIIAPHDSPATSPQPG